MRKNIVKLPMLDHLAMSATNKGIYYLPGANGRLETGLGEGLRARGFEVWGRATVEDFKRLTFKNQVDIIARDLQELLWSPSARVVANSYGAYLFLHAQLQLPPYVGKVLLLSPILGAFNNAKSMQFFVPPFADRIMKSVESSEFPTPINAEVHVGSEDWQSFPEQVKLFGEATGMAITIVEGQGHTLRKEYVSKLLDTWLTTS